MLKKIKYCIVVVIIGSFFCSQSPLRAIAKRIFTIESSQKALVLLKKIESTFEEALRHMLLAVLGYAKILDQQKNVWQGVEDLLGKMPLEIAILQEKINLLEKDNNDYTELINELFKLLNQMTNQVQMYSDYLKNIDAGLLKILEQQQSAQALVNNLSQLCEKY